MRSAKDATTSVSHFSKARAWAGLRRARALANFADNQDAKMDIEGKYPPAEPGALGSGPLEAAVGVADAAPIL